VVDLRAMNNYECLTARYVIGYNADLVLVDLTPTVRSARGINQVWLESH